MHPLRWRQAAIPLALLCIAAAQPETAPPAPPPFVPHAARGMGPLLFEQIARPNAVGQIVGSDVSFASHRLPATFAAMDCTATLVGPQVLLTAAHCIDGHALTGAAIKLARENARRRIASCAIAPAYLRGLATVNVPRNASDFALCEMEKVVPERAETLDTVPVAGNVRLMVAGYGCSEETILKNNGRIPQFHDEFSDKKRKLRVGTNTLATEPISGWRTLRGRIGTRDAVICPGDSGGAAYRGADPAPGPDIGWRVVAVNSAVGVSVEQHALDQAGTANPPGLGVEYQSYLSQLSDPAFISFVSQWQSQAPSKRLICGLGGMSSIQACRP